MKKGFLNRKNGGGRGEFDSFFDLEGGERESSCNSHELRSRVGFLLLGLGVLNCPSSLLGFFILLLLISF